MKISLLLLLIAAATKNVSAIFTPQPRAPIATVKSTYCTDPIKLKTSPLAFDAALAVSGGAIETDILVVDTAAAAEEVAENWGIIILSGTLGVVAGCLALYNPFVSTDVTFLSTVATLAVAGVINVGGSLFAERGYKLLTLIMGISQLALGGFMSADPFDSELGLSLAVTTSVFADGLYRVVLAVQNPELPGWWPTFLGGLVGMLTSVYVTKYMPLTFLAAPGIAVGVSLLSTGLARISVGLAGRDLAKKE